MAMSDWGQNRSLDQLGITPEMPNIDTDYSAKIRSDVEANTPDMNFKKSWWDGALDKSNRTTGEISQGWLSPAIQGVGALANAYLGYQQLQLGKSQLEQNKKIFNLNFGAQSQTLNTQMEDRQRARVASAGSGSSSLDSVDTYMSKNAIKTKGI